MEFLDIALRYAAVGLHVLPLAPKTKVPAIPKDPEKAQPLGLESGKGVHDATISTETITKWGTIWPNANIGLHPGPSGLIALDFDVKGGGLDTLNELRKGTPEIDDAWIQATPSGGFHYVFDAPTDLELNNPVRIMPGLDIRYNGTYIVVAPSVHPNGGVYTWKQKRGKRPPLLPTSILERLREAKKGPTAADRAFEDDNSPIEERHATLHSIGATARNRGFDGSSIKALLMDINKRRCHHNGMLSPLAEGEIDRIVASNLNLVPTYSLTQSYAQQKVGEVLLGGSKVGKRKLEITAYSDIEEKEIDWLWEGRLAYGQFSILGGVGGKGKSYATVALAAALSSGTPLPGQVYGELFDRKPCKTLLLTFEDDQGTTIRKRLTKCNADLSKVLTVPMDKQSIDCKDYSPLEDALTDNPDIKLVVIDPLNNILMGINDNSEVEVRAALMPLTLIASKFNVCVLGVKHLNKVNDGPPETRLGGSVAFYSIPRSVLLAGKDNEKPDSDLGTSYHGIVSIKTNIGRMPTGVAYEIGDTGLKWLGLDPTLTAPRILPLLNRSEKNAKG